MVDYKRMVIYLYSYINGKKGENVGFARLERRNNQIRILIRINGLGSDTPYKVYLIAKNNGEKSRYEWGNFIRRGSLGEFKGVTMAENVLGKGFGFDATSGIVVEGKGIVAGFWEDIDENPKEIAIYSSGQNVEDVNTDCSEDVNNVDISDNNPKRVSLQEMEIKEAKVMSAETSCDINIQEKCEEKNNDEKNQEEPASGNEEGMVGQCRDNLPTMEKEEEHILTDEDEAKQNSNVFAENESNRMVSVEGKELNPQIKQLKGRNWWKNIAGTKQIVEKQFDTNEDKGNIIKIELDDIKYLPSNCWICRNNSFLLHNYYIFKFLVVIHNDRGEYYLGVPGYFDEKEFAVANMFGFSINEKISQEPHIRGYWLKLIDHD